MLVIIVKGVCPILPSLLSLTLGYSAPCAHVSVLSPVLERTYKPHYHYQNFSPLAKGTDLNREKYAILQTHWHQNWSVMELKYP